MINHLALYLGAGGHSPGVFMLDPLSSFAELIEHLELVSYAGEPNDYRDHVEFVP